MVRELLMLGLSIIVVIAMAATLTVFFRRLHKIEEEKWGPETHPGFRAKVRALLKRRGKAVSETGH